MNNLDFKMKSIYHRNPETTLMLNGIQYTLYWTPHARERIISRLKSSLMLQNTYILDFINDLSNYDINAKSSEDEIADAVSEWLSDKYGFCHQGYNLEEDIL